MQYQFAWPPLDAAFMAVVLRWLMVLVVLVAAGYIIHGMVERDAAQDEGPLTPTRGN